MKINKVLGYVAFVVFWLLVRSSSTSTMKTVDAIFIIFILSDFALQDVKMYYRVQNKSHFCCGNYSTEILSTTPDYSANSFYVYVGGSFICPLSVAKGFYWGEDLILIYKDFMNKEKDYNEVNLTMKGFEVVELPPGDYGFSSFIKRNNIKIKNYYVVVPKDIEGKIGDLQVVGDGFVQFLFSQLDLLENLLQGRFEKIKEAVDHSETITAPRLDNTFEKVRKKLEGMIKK